MISGDRRFREDYPNDRYDERDRSRFEDRNFPDAAYREARNFDEDRYMREFDYSTGYNRSRDYGNEAYNRGSREPGNRYDREDYRYSYGRDRNYDHQLDSGRGYQRNPYKDDLAYRKAEGARPGYHARNYKNPENSDSYHYPERDRHDRARRFQASRRRWDPDIVENMDQGSLGMGHYVARGRNETLYGGRTEKHSDRNTHSGRGEDRGFFDRTVGRLPDRLSNRVRSFFEEDEERDRRPRYQHPYERGRY